MLCDKNRNEKFIKQIFCLSLNVLIKSRKKSNDGDDYQPNVCNHLIRFIAEISLTDIAKF